MPINSSLAIADGLLRTNPGAADMYYDGGLGAGYPDLATAYINIPVGVRNNKTFLVVNTEYWWQGTNTANGQEVLKTSGGGGGSGIGAWTAIPGISASVINPNIDLEYNNGTNAIFVRGQFSIADTFVGTSLVIGTLPASNYPKSQIRRVIENNGVAIYLTIDHTGVITLTSRDGFNLPTDSNTPDQYTIQEFYKPVAGGGGGMGTIHSSNSSNTDATIELSQGGVVITSFTSHAVPGLIEIHNAPFGFYDVHINAPAQGNADIVVNTESQPYAVDTYFLNKTLRMDITI